MKDRSILLRGGEYQQDCQTIQTLALGEGKQGDRVLTRNLLSNT